MSILFKTHAGEIKKISERSFQRIFNVHYCSRLIAPRELSPTPLTQIPALTYIQKIDDSVGYGLFAFKDIRALEIIGEYTGVLSTSWDEGPSDQSDFNPYLLKYPVDFLCAIDAQKSGNETRFINHSSKKANCERRYQQEENVFRVI